MKTVRQCMSSDRSVKNEATDFGCTREVKKKSAGRVETSARGDL